MSVRANEGYSVPLGFTERAIVPSTVIAAGGAAGQKGPEGARRGQGGGERALRLRVAPFPVYSPLPLHLSSAARRGPALCAPRSLAPARHCFATDSSWCCQGCPGTLGALALVGPFFHSPYYKAMFHNCIGVKMSLLLYSINTFSDPEGNHF